MVEVLTDNRNRTASTVKHAFDKYGGNLGVRVAYHMFERKSLFIRKGRVLPKMCSWKSR